MLDLKSGKLNSNMLDNKARSFVENWIISHEASSSSGRIQFMNKKIDELVKSSLSFSEIENLKKVLIEFLRYSKADQGVFLMNTIPQMSSLRSAQAFLDLFEKTVVPEESPPIQVVLKKILQAHQEIYDQTIKEGHQIQLRAHQIAYGSEPASERLSQIPDVFYLCHAQKKVLLNEKATFDSELANIFNKQNPPEEFLHAFQRHFILCADFALSEAAVAKQLISTEHFAQSSVLQELKSRRQLYTHAKNNLKQTNLFLQYALSRLKATDALVDIESKKKHLLTTLAALDSDILSFEKKVEQIKIERQQRFDLLENLLEMSEKLFDEYSFKDLLTQLILSDSVLREEALTLLNTILEPLKKIFSHTLVAYRSLNGSELIFKGINLLNEKLKAYHFNDLNSYKMINEQVEALNLSYKTLQSQVLTQPLKEWEFVQKIGDLLSSQIETVDLSLLQQEYQQYLPLEKASHLVEQFVSDIANLMDFVFENPSYQSQLVALHDEYLQLIKIEQKTFISAFVERDSQYPIQSGQLFSELIRAFELLKPGVEVRSGDFHDLDQLVNSITEVSIPIKILFQFYEQLVRLHELGEYLKHLTMMMPSEKEAHSYVLEQLAKTEQMAMGIVDLGWSGTKHQGFSVIPIEAEQFEQKFADAQRSCRPLVYVMAIQDGYIQEGGRMPLPKGIFEHTFVQESAAMAYESLVVQQIGKTVQSTLLFHYQDLILTFSQWHDLSSDDSLQLLLRYLFYLISQPNFELEQLSIIFSIELASKNEQLFQDIQNVATYKKRRLKTSEKEALLESFKLQWASDLQEGIANQLSLLKEALSDIQDLELDEAAIVLSYPILYLRQEVFRLLSFRFNPDFVLPLTSENTYCSNAEYAFFNWLNKQDDLDVPESLTKSQKLLSYSMSNLL